MLTPKELEVLNLVSRGLSTNKISEKLNISDNTVEGHRKVLLRKFQAKNSVDLVRKAMKANWIK
jgi:DNA-binding NarL/FixJ family response regulator